MPMHTNKAKADKKRAGLPKPKAKKPQTERTDVANARLPESSYIAQTPRPNLENRGLWVKQAYANGVSLPDIIRGSGLNVSTIFDLCGINQVENRDKYDDLVRFRNDLLFKNR